MIILLHLIIGECVNVKSHWLTGSVSLSAISYRGTEHLDGSQSVLLGFLWPVASVLVSVLSTMYCVVGREGILVTFLWVIQWLVFFYVLSCSLSCSSTVLMLWGLWMSLLHILIHCIHYSFLLIILILLGLLLFLLLLLQSTQVAFTSKIHQTVQQANCPCVYWRKWWNAFVQPLCGLTLYYWRLFWGDMLALLFYCVGVLLYCFFSRLLKLYYLF